MRKVALVMQKVFSVTAVVENGEKANTGKDAGTITLGAAKTELSGIEKLF